MAGASGPGGAGRRSSFRVAGLGIWLSVMTPRKALFETSDLAAEAEADARADADVRQGRTISHDAVKRWLSSWGLAKPMPRPRVGN